MRLVNTAAAPFLGSQFASLYLGSVRVPTVPGKPVITSAEDDANDLDVTLAAAPDNGGSDITAYRLYVAGVFAQDKDPTDDAKFVSYGGSVGDNVAVSAINAVGEGPKSAPFTVTMS